MAKARVKGLIKLISGLMVGFFSVFPALAHIDHSSKPQGDSEIAHSGQWSGVLEAGLISTSGNSQSEVFNSAVKAVREWDRWTQTVNMTTAGASFNGTRNKESYLLDGTVKFDLSEQQFLFVNARYFDDKFDSFSESVSAAGGAGFKPVLNQTFSWDVFTGIGYSHQSLEQSGEDISGVTFLGISRYSRKLTDSTNLDFNTTVEYKPENTFSRNEASLDVAINSTLALKLAYEIRYNSEPARVDKNLDTITKANIVYRF